MPFTIFFSIKGTACTRHSLPPLKQRKKLHQASFFNIQQKGMD
jgi:hypothetical protein